MPKHPIPELADLDPRSAAGILARAALAIESDNANPDSAPVQANELSLRNQIVMRISTFLESQEENKHNDIEQLLLDWLDNAAVEISEPEDDESALQRLSVDAALPSDAYAISFDERFAPVEIYTGLNDRTSVIDCIKNPDILEEFNPQSGPLSPNFISMFGKFSGSVEDKSRYLLLVVAERDGMKLIVKHYWRVYNSDVVLYPVINLTSVLNRFADIFGSDFLLNNWRGRFLVFEKFPENTTNIRFQSLGDGHPGDETLACIVIRIGPGDLKAAMGININMTKYRKRLRRFIKNLK